MNIPGPEDTLTLVILIIGIILFPAPAYTTVILGNAADPVPEIPVHPSTGISGEHGNRNNPETVFGAYNKRGAAPLMLRGS